MVERQPSKLRVAGSIPVSRSIVSKLYLKFIFKIVGQPVFLSWDLSLFLAHVAQSVEHFLGKEEAIGSNPIVGSNGRMDGAIFRKDKEGLSHVEAEV